MGTESCYSISSSCGWVLACLFAAAMHAADGSFNAGDGSHVASLSNPVIVAAIGVLNVWVSWLLAPQQSHILLIKRKVRMMRMFALRINAWRRC